MNSISTVTSPTRSFKDADSTSKSPGRNERKIIPMDMKLENRLNIKDLERLQEAFMTEGDGYDNKLSLTKNQFCEALSLLLKKGSREEYAELYDNIDVTRDGIVDWDKFASHMLLEFYEKDDRVKSTQVPQWKDLKHLQSPHKDIVQRVSYLKNSNRYLGISKEGCISMWNHDLKLQKSLKIPTGAYKARDLWVMDFVLLQNVNKIALAFTSKEIAIYDLSSKLEFLCQYTVQDLPYTPLSLDYWYNPDNANEATLVWGDVGGYVNILFFNSANIALFERPNAPAGDKQDPCLKVTLSMIEAGHFKNATYAKYQAHKDKKTAKAEWVRQVMYSHYLECFISCATMSNNAVVIGWMEKHTAVSGNVDRSQFEFNISQGVNAFDYNSHLNLIATAGVNNHVCLWNPYVVSKPNGVLRGHMAGVIQVQFIKNRGQLISFSKDKVLRLWDVQLQVCIQRLAGMFPKGPEVYTTLFFDDSRDRNGNERNRLFTTFNYQITMMEMKLEIKNRVVSHDKPVISAIYNTVFNQVVSVCQSGTIIMWMIDTGQKVKQFNKVHGNSEITCIAQDPTETRIYTGSTDGTVKVWDFNGHCYHVLDCAGGQPADLGQILILKRSVIVIGWTRFITVFRNTSFKDYHVQPSDWKGGQAHTEDILNVTFMGPHTLATGSYDGEIVIWNTNSELASKHMSQRSKREVIKSRNKEPSTLCVVGEETEGVRPTTGRSKSRALSRVSEGSNDEQNEFGWAICKLLFLASRKGNSASRGANLVSCGGNGWVRFWNANHGTLLAEFVAHKHAGSIKMATDKNNQYLATGDVDGNIKVWEIIEYCIHESEELLKTPPKLVSEFQPHIDMINTLEICERNDRLLVISASCDCSIAVWDVYGNKIGIFGQEEHWKVEPYSPEELEERIDTPKEDENKEEVIMDVERNSDWSPDEQAIDNPQEYRINSWSKTFLGKDYQELRVCKRERRQPSTIPNLPYLHWEKTGQPPAGPYSVSLFYFACSTSR
ncbi:hypothetical protein SNE40_007075 [Patella caerulea]|uniref:WD repeat-containing protein 49 n=1 Tax=Patella caerulea TaxID=87958 RepID=A0AAN8JWZ4_PATCE